MRCSAGSRFLGPLAVMIVAALLAGGCARRKGPDLIPAAPPPPPPVTAEAPETPKPPPNMPPPVEETAATSGEGTPGGGEGGQPLEEVTHPVSTAEGAEAEPTGAEPTEPELTEPELAEAGPTGAGPTEAAEWKQGHKALNVVVLGLGAFLLVLMVVVAVFVPNPTPFQFTVFRTTLATAVACVAASVPGFLLQDGASSEEPRQAGWIQLGGGVVMFLLVYGVDPVRRIGRGVRRSEDAPARTFAPEQSIFICYRHADSAEMADRLHERLAARYGDLAVFKDIEDIPLGVDFREVLKEALRRCKVVLALIGPDWETVAGETGRPKIDNPGDYVRNEIESSLERGLPVIPLLVRRTSLPPPDRLPPSMGKLPYLNMMEIRPDPDFDNDVARLVANVDRLLERK